MNGKWTKTISILITTYFFFIKKVWTRWFTSLQKKKKNTLSTRWKYISIRIITILFSFPGIIWLRKKFSSRKCVPEFDVVHNIFTYLITVNIISRIRCFYLVTHKYNTRHPHQIYNRQLKFVHVCSFSQMFCYRAEIWFIKTFHNLVCSITKCLKMI